MFSALIVGGAGYVLWAKEEHHPADHPPLQLSVDAAPLDRAGRLPISFAPVVKRAEASVVYISSTKRVRTPDMSPFFNDPMFRHFFGPLVPGMGGNPQYQREESLGSGVIVSSNGYILTNNHVVEGADHVTVKFADTQKQYTAKVIGRDPEADVAVLKIDATGLPAAVLGDSDQLQVGDNVLAVGDPFGIGLTVTHGIVSALGRNDLHIEAYEDFIQTDAPINPGNSGGPLLDVDGRVVGLDTAIVSQSGGSNGIGFAIPINLVRSLADQLIRTGKVERGFLGVELQEITPDLAEEFGTTSGALVADVEPGTPADKAGLKSGDVIVKCNGKKVEDFRQLRLAVGEMAPGTEVHLEYLRGKETHQVEVKLGVRPPEGKAGQNNAAPGTDNGVLDGVSVGDITSDLRDELQIPQGLQGAVITDVAPDSASAQAGLQKGDVILGLDRRPVHNADEAVKLSEEIKGPKVLVRLWHAGSTEYVVVDESQGGSDSGNGP
ncbi:MAG: DegQ family serine endoprotease [Opitutaceae bacterium]